MKHVLIAVGLCVVAQAATAEVYHYVNNEGRKIFVDRQSQIPPEYREQVVVKKSAAKKAPLVEPPASAEPVEGASPEEQIASMKSYMQKLETPVQLRGNSVLVPVRVTVGRRNATLNLILDTGATSTVIHDDALRGLGAGTSRNGSAQVAGGAVIETRAVTFDCFEVGPYTLDSVGASVIAHENPGQYDGLLGMDFLRSVKYEIDFDRSIVVWERDKYDQARRNLEQLQARLQQTAGAPGDVTN